MLVGSKTTSCYNIKVKIKVVHEHYKTCTRLTTLTITLQNLCNRHVLL